MEVNTVDYRFRALGEIDIEPDSNLKLRLDNNFGIINYRLGFFPEGAEIVAPFFVRNPKVQPLEIGAHGSTVQLAPQPGTPAEAWYSATLQGTDYRVSFKLTRSDGKNANVMGYVDVYGPIGEVLNGIRPLCSINEVSSSVGCVSKVSLVDETKVYFRLVPSGGSAYRAELKVEPMPE